MATNKRKQAVDLHQQGKLADALVIYNELLDENPQQADILHATAIIYAQQQQVDTALERINRALALDEHNASFYNSKGNILLRLNQIDEAIAAFQQAIAVNADYAIAHAGLGNCYFRRGLLNKAKRAYTTATQLQPKYVDALFNLGLVYAKLGEYEHAIKQFKKVVLLQPQRATAYGQIAEIYLQREDYKQAIEYYKKRLAFELEHADSYHNLGLALLKTHKVDEAIRAFEQALVYKTEHTDCHHNLATAYLEAGDYEKALNYYLRQLEIEPRLESYYNIGVLLMQQQRQREAIEYFEQAAKLDPDYLPTHLNLGALYLKGNKVAQAITHYQAALNIEPENAEIQHILSALTKEGTAKAAPAQYLQSLFDQYAVYYDQHLGKHLQYQVPQTLHQAVIEETNIEDPQWKILDLGCGTGLCGELFKRMARELIGVDLSENMVAVAKAKNIYSALEVADLHDSIHRYQAVDLILAADVFTYIGELDAIFNDCYQSLTHGGLFGFSVEKTYVEPYELQQSIRYAHSKNYLNSLIEKYGFDVLRFDNLVLRKQRDVAVEGYLVLLQKK